ncbi:MAG TPA: peptidase [Gammaproteobacteria bacterium]|nr:peptidase [Gammaproteobacteria bacterium]
MTYCVAIKLNEGLVLTSDSRTSAGVDDISVYSKMHILDAGDDRMLALLPAGNLATTQAVLAELARELEHDADTHLGKVESMFEAAAHIGELSARLQRSYLGNGDRRGGFNPEATFILAGEIAGKSPDILLIYPQGNFICASEEQPFLQVGETKYGKPILDRVIRPDTPLDIAARCAMVSMDASMRSNLSVGPPIDLVLYRTGSFRIDHRLRFDQNDPFWEAVHAAWAEGLQQTLRDLPRFDWER